VTALLVFALAVVAHVALVALAYVVGAKIGRPRAAY
jgi:hypothetical protein